MKTSLQGRLEILAREGLYLEAYEDIAGIWTIGVGHTAARGEPIPQKGLTITQEEALDVLSQDIEACEEEIRKAVKVELTQQQFDALVSWQFNLGRIQRKDVTLTKRLNERRFQEASDELLRWNKAVVNGVKVEVKGLTERRQAERAMFLNGDYGSSPITLKRPGEKAVAIARENFAAAVMASLKTDSNEPTATRVGQGSISSDQAQINAPDDLSGSELELNPDTKLLPRYRPQQPDATTRMLIREFAAQLVPEARRNDPVMILAVRGYYEDSLGKRDTNDRGIYDDAFFVIEPKAIHNFNGNTDPSGSWPGVAVLKAPQAVRYVPGDHGISGPHPYPAFRQNSPVTVVRDGIGERTDVPGNYFWINLHRGGNTKTSSEGCQTVPPNQWLEFRTLVYGLLKEHGQKDFYYVLITEDARRAASKRLSASNPPPSGDSTTLPHQNPGTTMTTPAPQTPTDTRIAEIAAIVAAVLQVMEARNGTNTPATSKPEPTMRELTEKVVELASTLPAKKPDLTPVNAALGTTVGNLLDGRKTALGTFGLLATTLLPALTPIIPALAPISAALTAAQPIALPLLSALTGWGVLGKVDKWFSTRVAKPGE